MLPAGLLERNCIQANQISLQVYFLLSSLSIVFYVIKGRPPPTKYLLKKYYIHKLNPRVVNHINSFEQAGKIRFFRYWTVEDYQILFDFSLRNSRSVILDRPPCEHGIRYLSLSRYPFSLTV